MRVQMVGPKFPLVAYLAVRDLVETLQDFHAFTAF